MHLHLLAAGWTINTNLPALPISHQSHPQTKADRFALMRPQADNLRALKQWMLFFLVHLYQRGDWAAV